MDNSYTESDVSLSPSQILERLQVLRQLQLLQQGKLQKQRLEYEEITENSSSHTEIVSHFSNTTSYNTFRSLLETPVDCSNDDTPRINTSNILQKVKEDDLIEGVSVLNLSQESEFILNTTTSTHSSLSHPRNHVTNSPYTENSGPKSIIKKQIAIDEMPILSPKKDFEALIIEKLQGELNKKVVKSPKAVLPKFQKNSKQFLRRGEGTSRFGLKKKDFVIQNTKSLPWRRKSLNVKSTQSPLMKQMRNVSIEKNKKVSMDIVDPEKNKTINKNTNRNLEISDNSNKRKPQVVKCNNQINNQSINQNSDHTGDEPEHVIELPKQKHHLASMNGKTWASVLSKEQNDFLQQLKQSDYYKNFASPAKSAVSDASCDANISKLEQERETAEQRMFELLESKVSHESFSLENSFFNQFLRRSQLECSRESTPLILQQCIAKNPKLMHIFPELNHRKTTNQIDEDTFNSECTDCCSETCSSASSFCSCKTVEETSNTCLNEKNTEKNVQAQKNIKIHKKKNGAIQKGEISPRKEVFDIVVNENAKSDTVSCNDSMKANMVEMNAKLIATSELLKDRLRELEDEIETFRQENASLTKMREEIDAERQKFYEEKALFEQKFNEEKILSEYYVAEEREKLTKQKQMYEKYVREMRGKLNKKDREEVINLKKEINNLKEDIRLKDAKSTTTIARLRNQMKIMEKEKKDLQDEIEKLKKENRRIQHSNDITRRMTNIKYLEEINKKLANMTAKETQSETNIDSNTKFKAFEIERQCRPRKVQSTVNRPMVRAKSVPNLKVTSRYAKYFSQRDIVSDMEKNRTVNVKSVENDCPTDNDESDSEIMNTGEESFNCKDSDNDDGNHLEKLYMERFHSISTKSINSNADIDTISIQKQNGHFNPDKFFLSKSNSTYSSTSSNNPSPINNSSGSHFHKSKSPTSIQSNRSSDQKSPRNFCEELHTNKSFEPIYNTSHSSNKSIMSKSPISILTNRSSSQKPATVIHNNYSRDTLNLSPEPTSSRSSVTRTNLNPSEIKKPDGSRELRFPNGNVKFLSADGRYCKFVYYNGDVKENFYDEGRIKYFYAETKTYHTTHPDGLEVLEFPDGQVEKRYKDGSTEIRLPNGSIRYFDPKNEHVREEWRFPDGTALTVSATGDQRIVFSNGQVEVHAKDHKRREFPDGTVKLVYNDGTSETRYASGRVRIKDKHGNLIMDSSSR